MQRSSVRRYAYVASVGALAGLTVVLLLPGGPLEDLLDRGSASASATSSPSVPEPTPTEGAGSPGAPAPTTPAADLPTTAGLTAALRGPLGAGVLGDASDVGLVVSDLASGTVLLADDPDVARVPASSAKLVTAVSALHHLGPDATLDTRTVRGAAPDEVVLVGGGDVTITRRGGGRSYPQSASLAELAGATAAALRADGRTSVRLVLDDTFFTAPGTAPGWEQADLVAGTVSRVSALTVDAARLEAGGRARATDPTAHAGALFARLLERRGVTVASTRRGQAPAGTAQLAAVRSPRVSALVERMLLASDNDVAEALGRAAGAAAGTGASFGGATLAATEALTALGVDPAGLVLVDASGLSRRDVVPPRLLADLLVLAARPDRPELAPVLTGLPAAGVEGTLADRFDEPRTRAGRGVVRAKTGTLTGSHSLAGVVADADGHQLAFALLAERTSIDSLAVRDALDRVATVLAACGCR